MTWLRALFWAPHIAEDRGGVPLLTQLVKDAAHVAQACADGGPDMDDGAGRLVRDVNVQHLVHLQAAEDGTSEASELLLASPPTTWTPLRCLPGCSPPGPVSPPPRESDSRWVLLM